MVTVEESSLRLKISPNMKPTQRTRRASDILVAAKTESAKTGQRDSFLQAATVNP